MSSQDYNYTAHNPLKRPLTPPDDKQHAAAAPFGQTRTLNNDNAKTFRRQHDETRWDDHKTQRNDVTQRIEDDVLRILQWQNPLRSGLILVLLVGSILLTGSYSLLQISAALITITIALNFVYVNFSVQMQRIMTEHKASHPYGRVFDNEQQISMDRQNVSHYVSLAVDVAETIIRALTRIILIENSASSFKWLVISYLTWTVSAHLTCRAIALFFFISAFIFPRLYISNKSVVDARLQQGQAMLHTQVQRSQDVASDAVNRVYSRVRTSFSKTGTTGTDVKNTLNKTSVTLKSD